MPFLLRLTAEERDAMLKRATVRRHGSGAVIIDQYDQSTDLFLVLEGCVSAKSYSSDGQEVSYAEIAKDDCFGEFSALDAAPRSTAVLAVTEVSTGRLTAASLDTLIRQYPGIGTAMSRHLVAKIRVLTNRISHFSTLPVHQRIRVELVRLARSVAPKGRTALLNPAPTHQDLATRLSTHREAVSREVSALERSRILRAGRRFIEFMDIDALETLIEADASVP
jgi:CRP/FNR family transcriptional regulator, cyclic AMP receptor protein